jgi:toxin ParE1/3/4
MLSSAREDLGQIVDYLSLFYENTAKNQLNRIIEKIELLAQFPFMCEEYESTISELQYRKMVVDNYLVFYVVEEDTVKIHSILNAKLNTRDLI